MERQYKDSGIEWIGRIPEDWEVLQIRRIMRNRSERNQPDAMVLSLYRDLGIVPKNSRDDNHNVTSEDTASYKVVSKGNFVINKMKAWQGSMAVSEYDGIVSPAYYVCNFTRDVHKKYIHYLLRDASYKPEYMRLSTGMRIGQWDLNIDDFLRIKAIIPPLAEQQRIADFLDEKCGEIDSLIGLQEQMIEKLKAYKQSVITEAVTKGLNPNAKLVSSGIDWIGEIPDGWKVTRMKFLGTFQNGLTYTPYDVCGSEGVLVLRSSNIQDSKLDFKDNVYVTHAPEDLMVEKGDIIICSRNGSASLVGKCALVEGDIKNCSFGAFMVRFRSNLDQKFAYYLVSTVIPQYKQLFTTTTINQLTKGMLSSMVGVLPSESEQQNIASYLDGKCSEIDNLIAVKQEKIEKLKDYKKSVIYEAVTGKTIL